MKLRLILLSVITVTLFLTTIPAEAYDLRTRYLAKRAEAQRAGEAAYLAYELGVASETYSLCGRHDLHRQIWENQTLRQNSWFKKGRQAVYPYDNVRFGSCNDYRHYAGAYIGTAIKLDMHELDPKKAGVTAKSIPYIKAWYYKNLHH